VRLADCASLIRSKNAGPFTLTFDIMFAAGAPYEHVKRSGVLNRELFAKLYAVRPDEVQAFTCDHALAFKFSIPRPQVQGDFGDGDLHGGQQYAPLLDIEVP
jgi:hypothetical protein